MLDSDLVGLYVVYRLALLEYPEVRLQVYPEDGIVHVHAWRTWEPRWKVGRVTRPFEYYAEGPERSYLQIAPGVTVTKDESVFDEGDTLWTNQDFGLHFIRNYTTVSSLEEAVRPRRLVEDMLLLARYRGRKL